MLPYGAVRDCNIDYIQKSWWISAQQVISGQVSGASTVLEHTMGAGTPDYNELGTSGIGAIQLAATTDEIDFYWMPENLDPSQRILIRHLWTSNYTTANGTATFTTLYNNHVEGAAVVIGATALDRTHGAATKVSSTARAVYWTPYGVIKANTLTPSTLGLSFDIKCTAVAGITIATDFVFWLGTQILYTPHYTFGDGNNREARLLAANLGWQEAGPSQDA